MIKSSLIFIPKGCFAVLEFPLGFEGYPELQRALKEYTSNKLTTAQRVNVMNDQLGVSQYPCGIRRYQEKRRLPP